MLTRKERTQVLVYTEESILREMCSLVVNSHQIKMIEEPNNVLVMIKMRESAQKHLFYLGEVYATECKTLVDGELGIGIIKGDQPQKAYCMAVIDGAYNAKISQVDQLDDMIVRERAKLEDEKCRKVSQILKTKVNFETLYEEVKF